MTQTLSFKTPNANSTGFALITFCAVVIAQWLHFSWYYKQEIGISLLWSIVDWSVWFALGFRLYNALKGAKFESTKNSKILLIVGFILLAGPLQITLITLIYNAVLASDKTVIESIIHLFRKRWLLNIFIGVIFVSAIVIHLLNKRDNNEKQASALNVRGANGTSTQDAILVLTEGKNQFHLRHSQIVSICSERNYLSIMGWLEMGAEQRTPPTEIVIRASLKSVLDKLKNEDFVQISRSTIVNKNYISTIKRYSKTSFSLQTIDGVMHNIGRTYKQQVLH